MTEHETEIPAESAEQIRQIAREEARDVYDDEVVEADGEEWSVRSMMDRFEISRRTALGAMGLLIAGVVADPAEAVMRSYVGTAEAQTGDLTVPGTLSADAVSTDEADITGETFIKASRGVNSSSTSSRTWVDVATSENEDVRGEQDSSLNINPDETGDYIVSGVVIWKNINDRDRIRIAVRDVDKDLHLSPRHVEVVAGADNHWMTFYLDVELTAGTNYKVQATDDNSSFVVGTDSEYTVKRSVVHP